MRSHSKETKWPSRRVSCWILVCRTSKYAPVVGALNRRVWNCKLLLCSVICYLCPLLPILIYSVTCHTWRQKYTDQAPANTLSICYFLHWHSYLDMVEQRGKAMYILGGAEVLSYLCWTDGGQSTKRHFYKEQRNFTPEERNIRQTSLPPCFRGRALLFVPRICLLA